MKIVAKLHTMFYIVGSKGTGKSTLAGTLSFELYKALAEAGTKNPLVRNLSFKTNGFSLTGTLDEGAELESHRKVAASVRMSADFCMQYPNPVDFLIIDGTHYSHRIGSHFEDLAKRQGYLFQPIYLNYSPIKNTTAEYKHSRKALKREIDQIFGANQRIDVKDFIENLEVEIPDASEYARCEIKQTEPRLAIIGDIHESVDGYEAMMTLLRGKGVTQFVSVGDYIDKGNDLPGILSCMEDFVGPEHKGYIVKGNHESYSVKVIRGELENRDTVMENKHMTAVKRIAAAPDLGKRLLNLYKDSIPYLHITRPGLRSIYVTHAPCRNEFLGKLSQKAKLAQRNLDSNRSRPYEESYMFVLEERDLDGPHHVFGHVALDILPALKDGDSYGAAR
jgi:predicted phosphodiesterase